MIFKPEQRADILQIMENNSIPTFEEYQKKMSKRLGDRVNASQNKNKKKK